MRNKQCVCDTKEKNRQVVVSVTKVRITVMVPPPPLMAAKLGVLNLKASLKRKVNDGFLQGYQAI